MGRVHLGSERIPSTTVYVLPLAAGTSSTIACEFDGGAFTSFHMLQGATCGGGGSPIADDDILEVPYAGTATDLNAENALVGYLLGNQIRSRG